MNVDISHIDSIVVVSVTGHLDSSNVKEFEDPALEAIDANQRALLLDFSGCTFMSSAGIRVILICAKKMQQQSGELFISGLNEYLTQVFAISGLPSILNIVETRDEALKQLQPVAKS